MTEWVAAHIELMMWCLVYGIFLRTDADDLAKDLTTWMCEWVDRNILGEED